MPRTQFFIVFLLALFSFGSLLSQTTAPKYSNEFLTIGVGARNFAMANSVLAGVNDVTAGYYNPSGLLGIEKDMEVGLMHSEYFAGIAKYDYLGFAKRIDENSVAGVSFIRFGTDDIPNTTQLIDKNGNIDYDRITRFSAADYALLLSYSRKTSSGLELGGNFKIIHRRIGDFARSWGFGLDVSVNYTYKDWKFAAVARDITTTVNAWVILLMKQLAKYLLQQETKFQKTLQSLRSQEYCWESLVSLSSVINYNLLQKQIWK